MKNGWQQKELGDVCERVTVGHVGVTTPHYRDEGVLFLRTQNVAKAGLVLDDKKYVTPEFHAKLKKSEVKAGDILMSRVITHSVHCALIPTELGAANCANVVLVRPGAGLLPEFLAYYIRSSDAQRHLLDRKVGSAQLVVNTKVVRTWPIPIPPLPEQRRIVGILAEAFDGIGTAQANAEKNLQNARALFESHLNAVFTQRGVGWVEKTLGELAEFKNGLNYTKDSGGQTLPVVGVGDFQTNVIVPIANLQTATIDGQLDDGYAIRQNDILTVRSNGSRDLVGRCMLVPKINSVISYSGFVIRIRFDAATIAPKFLLHMLKSSSSRDRLTRDGGGANISNINQGKLSSLPVPVPPFCKQEAIANTLDVLSAETQHLESIYQRKLAALDELKKSLLHQAFSGEL